LIVKSRLILFKLIFFIIIDLLESQVDIIGDQFFTFNYESDSVSLPIFSNVELNENNIGLEKAIIVMHGQNRNADDYFNSINSITSSLGIQNETLIIAPQFLLLEDIDSWNLGAAIPYWQNNTGWTTGNQSLSTLQHPRDFQLSSFTIIDSLLLFIHSEFTNIEKIILVGNSAGGQLLNRYAGGSPIAFNEKIKFIISAPSSFLYFDENRYEYPNSWTLPSGCNNYNEYKYGLDDLNNYMSVASEDSIIARYQKRKITYMVGEQDNGGTTDCQSMVQGEHRLERSLNYYNYLQHYFSQNITNKQNIIIIPNVDHYHDEIFNSPCGRKAIFGLGDCQQIDNLTAPSALFSTDVNFGNYPLVVNFMNNSTQGTHDIKYLLWEIEDESIYTTGDLEYTFNYPGVYNALLIAIDKIGQRDTSIAEAIVTVDTLFGDVNLDAIVNSNDAEDIIESFIGDMPFDAIQMAIGDLDNDGTLSPFDGSLILQYLEGNITQIPIEEGQGSTAFGGLKELEISGDIGEIIQIPILLENAENIYSFRATINFDPNVTSAATIYTGNIAESGFIIKTRIEDDGKILLAGAGSTAASDDVEIANFYFIPLAFTNGENIFYCENLYVNNIQIEESFSIKVNQTLTVEPNLFIEDFSLGNNYPNPFNATTKIMFNLDKNFNLRMQINNLKGQLVRTLSDGFYTKGSHNAEWNGKDNEGNIVVSGVYIYKILINNRSITKKMLFVK
tara:strand:- start:16 stop:2202 length:2187 start_codon:yes stop_codon:yes gene_type:complete